MLSHGLHFFRIQHEINISLNHLHHPLDASNQNDLLTCAYGVAFTTRSATKYAWVKTIPCPITYLLKQDMLEVAPVIDVPASFHLRPNVISKSITSYCETFLFCRTKITILTYIKYRPWRQTERNTSACPHRRR